MLYVNMAVIHNFKIKYVKILFEQELIMPTLQAKYKLCKILVSDSLLRKDFFP